MLLALGRTSEEPLLLPARVIAAWQREQDGGEPAPPPKREVSAGPTSGELARAAYGRERRQEEEDRRAALVRDVAGTIRKAAQHNESG